MRTLAFQQKLDKIDMSRINLSPAHQNIGGSKVLFYTLSALLLLRTSLNDYAPPFCFCWNAEVLICKAFSDWSKFCLLLSFCYLKL